MTNIPQIMSRIWDGDPNEYFTASDMRRVEDNANIIARYAGVPEVTFLPTTRESQFRYDEAQKIENQIKAIGKKLGVSVDTEDHWNYNRTLSYIDFERIESQQWRLYKALGGVGDRIPSDKFLHTVHATLFASEWRGTSPYYIDLDMPAIRDGMDATIYVSEDSSPVQRMDEFNARMQMVPLGPQRVRVYAMGIKPSNDIPIEITTKVWEMYKQVILRSSGWQGSGPWTQTIDIGTTVKNAVVGSDERNNPKQLESLADAVIGVSAVNGSKVTLRAIGVKPTIDINASVMWVASEVA